MNMKKILLVPCLILAAACVVVLLIKPGDNYYPAHSLNSDFYMVWKPGAIIVLFIVGVILIIDIVGTRANKKATEEMAQATEKARLKAIEEADLTEEARLQALPKLINCPACNKEISNKAVACPSCGHPISLIVKTQSPAAAELRRDWNPGIAALLSFIFPGAGQMYKGKVGVGLLWFIFVVIGYFLFIIPGVFLHLVCIFNAAKGEVT